MSTLDADGFVEFVRHLCQRRTMYVSDGTFYEVSAYLSGYFHGAQGCPLGDDNWKAFTQYVCALCGFPRNYFWAYVIRQSSRDDEEALAKLQTALAEFVELSKSQTHEDIIYAALMRFMPPQ